MSGPQPHATFPFCRKTNQQPARSPRSNPTLKNHLTSHNYYGIVHNIMALKQSITFGKKSVVHPQHSFQMRILNATQPRRTCKNDKRKNHYASHNIPKFQIPSLCLVHNLLWKKVLIHPYIWQLYIWQVKHSIIFGRK